MYISIVKIYDSIVKIYDSIVKIYDSIVKMYIFSLIIYTNTNSLLPGDDWNQDVRLSKLVAALLFKTGEGTGWAEGCRLGGAWGGARGGGVDSFSRFEGAGVGFIGVEVGGGRGCRFRRKDPVSTGCEDIALRWLDLCGLSKVVGREVRFIAPVGSWWPYSAVGL